MKTYLFLAVAILLSSCSKNFFDEERLNRNSAVLSDGYSYYIDGYHMTILGESIRTIVREELRAYKLENEQVELTSHDSSLEAITSAYDAVVKSAVSNGASLDVIERVMITRFGRDKYLEWRRYYTELKRSEIPAKADIIAKELGW